MKEKAWVSDDIELNESYSLHMSGQASPTGDEPREDWRVEALHQVVEEITGKPVVRPKKGMGFVW